MGLTEIIGLIMTGLMIIAILLAPRVALQARSKLDKDQQLRDRRLWVFKVLMGTRASRITSDHVHALNSIDLEFYGDDEDLKAVVEAWEQYKMHLFNRPKSTSKSDSKPTPAEELWVVTGDNLFMSLLRAMSICLGYNYDISSLQRTSYFPEGHSQMEFEQTIIRKELTLLLSGNSALPIRIVSDETKEPDKTGEQK